MPRDKERAVSHGPTASKERRCGRFGVAGLHRSRSVHDPDVYRRHGCGAVEYLQVEATHVTVSTVVPTVPHVTVSTVVPTVPHVTVSTVVPTVPHVTVSTVVPTIPRVTAAGQLRAGVLTSE
jgi:hypothetical protein